MANDDYKTKWEKFLQEAVREAVKEQLGMTDGEMTDAEKFLAIPTDRREPHCEACGLVYDEPMHAWEHRCTVRAQSLSDRDNGRWGDFSYSDHAFLYDVGISLDNEDGGSL